MSNLFNTIKTFVTSIPAKVKALPKETKMAAGAIATGILAGGAVAFTKYSKAKHEKENAIIPEHSEVE